MRHASKYPWVTVKNPHNPFTRSDSGHDSFCHLLIGKAAILYFACFGIKLLQIGDISVQSFKPALSKSIWHQRKHFFCTFDITLTNNCNMTSELQSRADTY